MKRYVCIRKLVYRVRYYLWFQASAGVLEPIPHRLGGSVVDMNLDRETKDLNVGSKETLEWEYRVKKESDFGLASTHGEK